MIFDSLPKINTTQFGLLQQCVDNREGGNKPTTSGRLFQLKQKKLCAGKVRKGETEEGKGGKVGWRKRKGGKRERCRDEGVGKRVKEGGKREGR